MTTHPTALETALKEFEKRKLPSRTTKSGYKYDVDWEIVRKDLTSFATTLLSEARAKTMVEEQTLPKTKCINAENHLFGSCFQCEKTKGFNAALTAVSNRWDELYPNSK